MQKLIIIFIIILFTGCSLKEAPQPTKEQKELEQLVRNSGRYINERLLDSALISLDLALPTALKIQDSIALSSIYSNFGVYQYLTGALDSSINWYGKALSIDIARADSSFMIRRLKHIGISYREKGWFDKAINYYLKALSIANSQDDHSQIASISNSLGNLYNQIDKNEDALKHFGVAKIIWMEQNKTKQLAYLLNNSANSYLAMEKYTKAIKTYKEALILKEELGEERSIAYTLSSLAEAYILTSEFDRASKLLIRARHIREKAGDTKGLVQIDLREGMLQHKLAAYERADQYLMRASTASKTLGINDVLLEALKWRIDNERARGKLKSALQINDDYTVLKEQLLEEQKLGALAQQADFDIERAQEQEEFARTEAKLAGEQIATQKKVLISGGVTMLALLTLLISTVQSRKKIRSQNHEIERLNTHLQQINIDILHRKSNDQASILAQLDVLKSTFPETLEQLQSMENFLIVSNEIDLLALKGTTKTEQIHLTDYLDNVFNQLKKRYKHEEATLTLPKTDTPFLLSADKASKTGLIIAELFLNSVKHADLETAGALKIDLQLSIEDHAFYFCYKDNGKPKVSESTSLASGIGLKMVSAMITSLDGKLKMAPENMFNVTLQIPQ